jgi:Ca-activated chloride channel family protein
MRAVANQSTRAGSIELSRRAAIRSLLLAAAAIRSRSSHAQSPSDRVAPRPRFRADSIEVRIPFIALDRHEHLVPGITAQDLRLLADGKEQKIDFVSVEEGPVSTIFVIDISGSMKKPVSDVREAVRRVLMAATADDEFAVVEFSDKPRVTLGFTGLATAVEERIRRMAPVGRTSLTDAVTLALLEMRRARHSRKAIIVVSDGQDNHSRYGAAETLRLAVESDARAYGIELYPPIGEGAPPYTFLELLARGTGGRYLPTITRGQIPDLVDRIDVHRQYVVGFRPPAAHRDDRSHRVDLSLRTKFTGGRIRLYWKEWYRIDPASH